MNYLAHAYLSFGNNEILIGNMISDFVKGKTKFSFPLNIQKGIFLHRAIDSFTDIHPVTKHAKQVFKPVTGHYAGVFTDIVYDHFLATDEKEFPSKALENFAEKTYEILNSYTVLLPAKFNRMLSFMSSQNWLLNYRFTKGIENSFAGIFTRAKYLEKNNNVFDCFIKNYDTLYNCYQQFFPEVKEFAFAEYSTLIQG
ncbi:MAG TPA: ACP phosphodiesterase [Chitinophagaceae bacterium]|nr:ACP phosphodiesterase [Chitinophagaceae bacterium]